ncbi:T6SS effector amidase Tae4 family protein [Burkholderia sp. NLJ2]|uniref:T6SS effector amidase Tae4 family protein n=1 Tax=Burkholderia sp. NLJ2 TaxID=3090699 RepID=UPI003C6CB547
MVEAAAFCGPGEGGKRHWAGLGAEGQGRTGIIMFDGYWAREGEATENASGGHIYLWNGNRLTISSPFNIFATTGRLLGRHSFRPGHAFGWSDLRNSRRILFWEVR